MLKLFVRIINKLKNAQPLNPNILLIQEGFFKMGQGCKIDGLSIHVADKKPGVLNIEIGNNCCLLGTIIIYRPEAKVKIGNNVYIGPGTILECAEEIEIGSDILISGNCNIIDTNSHSLHSSERINDTIDWQKGLAFKNWNVVESKKISIKSNSWIGLRSIILKGITIEKGTIVGAGSVVTKSTIPFSIVAGNPAKFIREAD